jgi:prevent-host-death family protein
MDRPPGAHRGYGRRILITAPASWSTGSAFSSCRTEPPEAQLDVLWEGPAMPKIPDILPVTDLRRDAAAALKRVRTSIEPLVITQRGRAAAVLLSIEAYERGEHERRLLRLLARGEKEITAGQGHDLDDVLEEADALLARALE